MLPEIHLARSAQLAESNLRRHVFAENKEAVRRCSGDVTFLNVPFVVIAEPTAASNESAVRRRDKTSRTIAQNKTHCIFLLALDARTEWMPHSGARPYF